MILYRISKDFQWCSSSLRSCTSPQLIWYMLNCHINLVKMFRTCSINHTGSINVNLLKGRHIHKILVLLVCESICLLKVAYKKALPTSDNLNSISVLSSTSWSCSSSLVSWLHFHCTLLKQWLKGSGSNRHTWWLVLTILL